MTVPEVSLDAIGSEVGLGMLGRSRFYPWLRAARLGVRLRLPTPDRLREHQIGGRIWPLTQPITFTPFASARACSARCVFCSVTASLQPERFRCAESHAD